MNAMEIFLSDYKIFSSSDRYINASLPLLPFDTAEFVLALCSQYLFLYSSHIDEAEHIASMMELCRVAKEVRVYPLLSLDGKTSKYLNPVMSALSDKRIEVSLQPVAYQFQKGANEMLVARHTEDRGCAVNQ